MSSTKGEKISDEAENLWVELFESPIHLDSALSKRRPNLKSILAKVIPAILARPVSTAEQLGVGVPSGEPWSLAPEARARWRPVRFLAEQAHAALVAGGVPAQPIREDFPPAYYEEWAREFGAECADGLIAALGAEAPLGLRASRRVSPQAVLEELRGPHGLHVKSMVSDVSPVGIRLMGYASVLNSPAHERGDLEIQDEGSQIMAAFALWPETFAEYLSERPGAVKVTAPKALPQASGGLTVIDACAGAGGKTLALGDMMSGKGRVFAYDVSERKLQALRRRASQARLTNVQAHRIEPGKESELVEKFKGQADHVLVDAPCSGWGVLRRNPDIKWRQTPEDLARMPVIQKRLLSVYSGLVAPGGKLCYGVCTFRGAETRDVIDDFLASHPDFVSIAGGFLGPGPTDGFFMHAFQRKA